MVCPQPLRDLVITCHKGQEISPRSIPKYRNRNDPSVSSTGLDHKGLENRSQLSSLDQRHQGYGQGSTPQEVRLPRDRLEKRSMRNLLNHAGTLRSPSYQAKEGKSKEPCRSFELDDDGESLSFSQELRNAHISIHFVPSKIPKYEGKGDPTKHLNNYKTHMSLWELF